MQRRSRSSSSSSRSRSRSRRDHHRDIQTGIDSTLTKDNNNNSASRHCVYLLLHRRNPVHQRQRQEQQQQQLVSSFLRARALLRLLQQSLPGSHRPTSKSKSRTATHTPTATRTVRTTSSTCGFYYCVYYYYLYFVIVITIVLHDPPFHTCTALITTATLPSSLQPPSKSAAAAAAAARSRSRLRTMMTSMMTSMMTMTRSSVVATAAARNLRSITGSRSSNRSSSLLFTTTRSLSSSSSSSSSITNDDGSPSPSPSPLSSPPALFRIYYNDVYKVDLPPKHRFPMWKYERVRKQIQSSLLLSEYDYDYDYDFHVSPLATKRQLETTHCPEYIQRFLNGQMTDQENRNVGFPWSKQGVDRALSSVGGTVAAATYVCDQLRRLRNQSRPSTSTTTPTSRPESESRRRSRPSWAAHVAGGTHHAFYDYGEGFSVFSDIAVAANVVLMEYPDVVRNILIVDLDVHQGNGNAKLFETNPNVFTFSIHCDANYFSKKELGDLDIELPAGCTDPTYLMTLNHWLNRFKHAHFNALEQEKEEEQEYQKTPTTTTTSSGDSNDNDNKRVNSNDSFKIDLIFFQAGVDILDDDRLGRMDISSDGLRRRNEMVYQFANDIGVPVVVTMGGGYPKHEDNWSKLIDAHSNVYIQAYEFLKDQRQKDEEK